MAILTLIALQNNNSKKAENNFFDQRNEMLDDLQVMCRYADVQMCRLKKKSRIFLLSFAHLHICTSAHQFVVSIRKLNKFSSVGTCSFFRSRYLLISTPRTEIFMSLAISFVVRFIRR